MALDFEFELFRGIERNDPEVTVLPETDLNDEKAIQLGRALKGNTHVTCVVFGMESIFTAIGAQALAEGILESETCSLEMRRPHAISADFLCNVLTRNRKLTTVSLDVGHLACVGAKLLSNGLQRSYVRTLVLRVAPGQSPPTPRAIHVLCREGLQGCATLETLDISGLVIDMDVVTALLPQLLNLRINNTSLASAQVGLLASAFMKMKRWTSLELSACGLGDEHLRALSNSLGGSRSPSYTKFFKWDFQQNNIGPTGAQILLQTVSNRRSPYTICLKNNKAIGYDGLRLIGEELPNSELMCLDLDNIATWTDFKDLKCEAAVNQEAKRDAASQALIKGIRGNFSLDELHVRGLHLPESILAEAQLYFKANLGGRRIVARQNELPKATWCHVLAKQKNDTNLLFLYVRDLSALIVQVRGEYDDPWVVI